MPDPSADLAEEARECGLGRLGVGFDHLGDARLVQGLEATVGEPRCLVWIAGDNAPRAGHPPSLLLKSSVAGCGRGVASEACSDPGSDEAQRAGDEVVVIEAGVVLVFELIAEAAQS